MKTCNARLAAGALRSSCGLRFSGQRKSATKAGGGNCTALTISLSRFSSGRRFPVPARAPRATGRRNRLATAAGRKTPVARPLQAPPGTAPALRQQGLAELAGRGYRHRRYAHGSAPRPSRRYCRSAASQAGARCAVQAARTQAPACGRQALPPTPASGVADARPRWPVVDAAPSQPRPWLPDTPGVWTPASDTFNLRMGLEHTGLDQVQGIDIGLGRGNHDVGISAIAVDDAAILLQSYGYLALRVGSLGNGIDRVELQIGT